MKTKPGVHRRDVPATSELLKGILCAGLALVLPAQLFANFPLRQLQEQVAKEATPGTIQIVEIGPVKEEPLRSYIRGEWNGDWSPEWERSSNGASPLIQLEDGSLRLTSDAVAKFQALAERAYFNLSKNYGRKPRGMGLWPLDIRDNRHLRYEGDFLNRNFLGRELSFGVEIGRDHRVTLQSVSMTSDTELNGHMNTSRESWQTKYAFFISGDGGVSLTVPFEYTDGAGAGHAGGLTSTKHGDVKLENQRVLAIFKRNLNYWLIRR